MRSYIAIMELIRFGERLEFLTKGVRPECAVDDLSVIADSPVLEQ